jgi:asparagine synthase (glutamine-hydrolysing)
MCGIAGIFHLDGERAVERDDLVRMTRIIAHRGPDDEGFFVEGPVGFGVRRLSIVDRALGHQPLTGEDGSIWIAFNGEIYNHPDLRESLIARGHTYRTNCDTETVVHAYEEYGEPMVKQLRGMFAFALWDRKKGRLLLYRDRLGIKPLYYCQLKNTLVFASEVKALLEYGVPFAVEEEVLECSLRLGYVPGERTLFRQVHKLLPGHFLVAGIGNPNVQVHRYWSPRFEPTQDGDEAHYLEQFQGLLDETVAQHRLGEVPQGIFLSGGVDSSSLLAVTAKQVSEPVLTFSVGYREEREISEFPYARRVAKLYGARHFEYELSGKNFAESLPKLIWHMDEAVADPAAIPLFFLSQLAREHITVVHSGEGADEILAGYSIYRKMQRISALQKWAGALGAAILASGLKLPGLSIRLRRYAELIDKPLSRRYHGVRRVLTEELLRQMARDGFPTFEDSRYRLELFSQLYGGSQGYPELNQMLSVDLQSWLPDDLLLKADKMTMAASMELRVPFLDHRVVEFAGGLPCDLKLRNGQSKYLRKKLMQKRVPAEILLAVKRGFRVPLSQWLRGGLYGAARAWLLDSRFLREFLIQDRLEKLLRSHHQAKGDFSSEIYGLACLAIWHDVFAGQAPKPAARAPGQN